MACTRFSEPVLICLQQCQLEYRIASIFLNMWYVNLVSMRMSVSNKFICLLISLQSTSVGPCCSKLMNICATSYTATMSIMSVLSVHFIVSTMLSYSCVNQGKGMLNFTGLVSLNLLPIFNQDHPSYLSMSLNMFSQPIMWVQVLALASIALVLVLSVSELLYLY